MKKIVTLSVVGLASLLAFTVACDDGSVAVDCTSDTDCEGEAENTVCDTDVGVCVAPAAEECAEDTDCDLQDTSAGSPIYGLDELDAGNDTCEDEGAVTIVGFDGVEYCAQEDTADLPCAATETSVTADRSGGGTVDVCVLADGTCSEDGTCS